MAAEDAAAAADALLPLIRRVSPGALEKAEIVEQSGLEAEEIREGLALLEEQGKIEDTDDGYRVVGTSTLADSAASGPGGDGDGEKPREDDPASPASVPGSAQSYRATFSVTATYGGAKRDEAALQQAAAMEEEIAEGIHALYPNAVIAVDVVQVEAYKPRVIYGKDAEEQEEEEEE